jgi:hypothetical protein
MVPRSKSPPNRAVNWPIPGQLIDQFPAAVVVVNGPPLKGAIDHLPPSLTSIPTPAAAGHPKVARCRPWLRCSRARRAHYPPEASRIDHREAGVLSVGGANVLY